MKEFGTIKDRVYPKQEGKIKIRQTVRAILLRKGEKGLETFLLHISGKDLFGEKDYFETPGGGVEKGETLVETLFREIQEETGYIISDYQPLGSIANEYNIINHLHLATYFLAYAGENVGKSLLEYEKDYIDGGKWYPINEAISLFQSYPTINIGLLVHERERKMFKYAIETKFISLN